MARPRNQFCIFALISFLIGLVSFRARELVSRTLGQYSLGENFDVHAEEYTERGHDSDYDCL